MQFNILNLSNDQLEKIVYRACIEYGKILFPSLIHDPKYTVDVAFVDKISDGAYGETKWFDRPKKPRHCTIQIRKMKNNRMLLSTLAHELVHVKQLFLNELVDDIESETDYIWKSKYRFNITKDYWLLPWELEANGYEIALLELFRAKFLLTQKDIQTDLNLVIKKIEHIDSKAVD